MTDNIVLFPKRVPRAPRATRARKQPAAEVIMEPDANVTAPSHSTTIITIEKRSWAQAIRKELPDTLAGAIWFGIIFGGLLWFW